MIPSGEKLKVSDKLMTWSRYFSLVLLGLVAVITLFGSLVSETSALEILLSASALAAAAMSESFGVIGDYAVACSVRKSDSEDSGRAKVKNAATVELLNASDTLLLESPAMIKAGDITLNSYYTDGRLINIDEPVEGISPAELLKLCYVTTGLLPQGMLTANVAAPVRESSSVDYAGIRKIFEEYFASSTEERALENTVIVGHEPAGGAESGGLDTVLICRQGNFEAVVSGSIEEVLSCCTSIRRGGRVLPITKEDFAAVRSEAEVLRRRGIFTVAVARRDSPYINMNRVSALQMCMTFEGFLALSDRAHGDAMDALRKCREGDRMRMVCFTEGSAEDRAFLEMIGFLTEKDKYITLEEAFAAERIALEPGQFAAICTGSADAARLRREFAKKLLRGGCRITYASCDPADMWLMKEAPVSVAVPAASKIKKTIPQAIRSSSDVVITPQGGGGVYETFRVTEFSKGAFMNLRRCANYLAASNVARILLVLVSALISGVPVASPVALLVWGLLLDLAVAFVALRRDPPWNIVSVKGKAHRLQSGVRDFARPAALGALWSAVIIALPIAVSIYRGKTHPLEGPVITSLAFVAALISIPVFGGELMTNGSIFKRSKRRSRAIPALFFLCIATAALFSFLPAAAKFVGGTVITVKLFITSFIPAVITLAVFEIIKFTTKKNKMSEDEKNDINNSRRKI